MRWLPQPPKTLVEIPHREPSTAPGQISQFQNICRVLTDWLMPQSNQSWLSFSVPLLEGIGVFNYFQDIEATCQEDGSKTRQRRMPRKKKTHCSLAQWVEMEELNFNTCTYGTFVVCCHSTRQDALVSSTPVDKLITAKQGKSVPVWLIITGGWQCVVRTPTNFARQNATRNQN